MSTEKREPVKYTVLKKSLVGNKIYEEGETVEYDGLPAENLAPQCEVGHARFQEYTETNKARVAKMMEFHGDAAKNVGDPAAFQAAFLEALAESNKVHAEQMAALQVAQADLIAKAVASAFATAFPNGTGKAAAKAWTPKGAAAAESESAGESIA
jgi:hypothetical protein